MLTVQETDEEGQSSVSGSYDNKLMFCFVLLQVTLEVVRTGREKGLIITPHFGFSIS